MFQKFILAGSFAALLAASPAVAEPAVQVREDRIVDTVLTDGLDAAKGQWRTRIQVIFDPKAQQLERRAYEVFDLNANQNLTFTWQADDLAADKPGKITGAGRLVWREADKPAYDDTGITSAYRGTLRNGRAEGQGLYATRDGLSYDGQWKAGRPHGRGRLVLPNGEEYEGEFRDGFAEGAGRYTETTWERFEGTFRRGLRSGAGKTTLPSGLAYESNWAAGRETPNSYRIRVAQVGAAPAVGGIDDVRMGVTLDRTLNLSGMVKPESLLNYEATRTPDGIEIKPSDRQMLAVWLAKGEIRNRMRFGTARSGMFSIMPSYILSPKISTVFSNNSKLDVDIIAFQINIKKSATVYDPAIELATNLYESCGGGFGPTANLENFGWSDAVDNKIKLSFVGNDDKIRKFESIYEIEKFQDGAELDLSDQLKSAGVNIDFLEKNGNNFKCASNDKVLCLKQLQSNPVFGKIGWSVKLLGSTIYTSLKGTYEYKWQDHDGVKTKVSPIFVEISLGFLNAGPECGSIAPEMVRENPIRLRQNRENYVETLPFRRHLAPGRSATYTMALDAEKSSRHQFEIVARLADGRELKSPPINMLYFRPRPFKTN